MSLVLAVYLFVFGVAAGAGGLMGFLKAQSKASLIAGSISGILLLIAGALVVTGNVVAGAWLAVLVSLALFGRFAPAFAKTRKVMPGGLMVVLSVIALVLASPSLFR